LLRSSTTASTPQWSNHHILSCPSNRNVTGFGEAHRARRFRMRWQVNCWDRRPVFLSQTCCDVQALAGLLRKEKLTASGRCRSCRELSKLNRNATFSWTRRDFSGGMVSGECSFVRFPWQHRTARAVEGVWIPISSVGGPRCYSSVVKRVMQPNSCPSGPCGTV
jgi:hypothetical protein